MVKFNLKPAGITSALSIAVITDMVATQHTTKQQNGLCLVEKQVVELMKFFFVKISQLMSVVSRHTARAGLVMVVLCNCDDTDLRRNSNQAESHPVPKGSGLRFSPSTVFSPNAVLVSPSRPVLDARVIGEIRNGMPSEAALMAVYEADYAAMPWEQVSLLLEVVLSSDPMLSPLAASKVWDCISGLDALALAQYEVLLQDLRRLQLKIKQASKRLGFRKDSKKYLDLSYAHLETLLQSG